MIQIQVGAEVSTTKSIHCIDFDKEEVFDFRQITKNHTKLSF